jgi:hypothetical protein
VKTKEKIYMWVSVLTGYERLQPKTKEFSSLSYKHLKIETRLITEMFANVMGECEN